MLRRYVEQILSLYNYIDGIIVTDKDGYVEYFQTFRPDVNNLKERDVIHKHILEVYPKLTEETSSIMRVLKSGKPISNEFQTLYTYKGQRIRAVNTTLPIKERDEIIGAVDASRYLDYPYDRQDITISMKDNKDNIDNKKLYTTDDIITNSNCMKRVVDQIPLVAATNSSVLIYGETGTGKELIAQSLHTSGRRKNKKFVSQNCAAIPGNLLESILFGTTKGSYTGAENKPGLFEIANGGTLFLDEINSMELSVQPKLLKAIEEKQTTRLGGYDPIKTDIKIIAAVNEDPQKCIEEKKLRDDLFYRLSVVQINLPPLRERGDDISYMTSYFIQQYNNMMNRDILGVDEEVEHLFKEYRWPGNVRELKNVIEGAFNVVSSRFIQMKDLPKYLSGYSDVLQDIPNDANALFETNGDYSLNQAMSAYEKKIIIAAIDSSDSLVNAAKRLGITKQALNYKIKKYNIK